MLRTVGFGLLPISVPALVFGVCAETQPRPDFGRIGMTPAVVTAAPAPAGAAVFATMSWRHVGPPAAYFDTQTGSPR